MTRLRHWLTGAGYAAVPLLIGQVAGGVAFAVNPNAAEDIGASRVSLPTPIFMIAWLVVYPAMGIAAWQLRLHAKPGADLRIPLAVLAAGILQSTIFWLSSGLQSVAVADLTGTLFAATTFFVFSRYSWAATRWLLPWLIWMPATLAIKVYVLLTT